MKKILVTGAGGYIGTTLVPKLLEKGYHVRAIDRYFFGENLLKNHEHLEIIKEDSRKISSEHFKGIHGVIDLVAVSNDPSGDLYEKETWEINHESRARTARLSKEAGVKRYILPSTCSIYGFQDEGVICDENSSINPLTTYSKSNRSAEKAALELCSEDFVVAILRQATVFGYSPRMRFDLAINGMTFGAWKTGKLPLMRDGKQWRPMLHVKDAASAQIFLLEYSSPEEINGQIFNIGSEEGCYQIGNLAEIIAKTIPKEVVIEWYGDPDHRSYRVNFDKIESIGWKAKYKAEDGCLEIFKKLEDGKLQKDDKTITLTWYKNLHYWKKIIDNVEMYEGILKIDDEN